MSKRYKALACCIGVFLAFAYIPHVTAGDGDGDPECDAGQYFDLDETSCLSCQPGRYNPDGSGNSCTPCAPGTFQDESGSYTCNQCEPGTYTEFSESLSCTPCPVGMTSGPGATDCYERPSGKRSSIVTSALITDGNGEENADTSGENDNPSPLTSYTLDESDNTLLSSVVERIKIFIQLHRSPNFMYEKTITLLESYLTHFTTQGNDKNIALAKELISLMKSLFEKN